MNLQAIINPAQAEGHPGEIFFMGLIYSMLAAGVVSIFFADLGGLGLVLFTVIACIPLVYNTTMLESKKASLRSGSEAALLKEHKKAITVFTFLFLGFVTGYLAIFLLPLNIGEHLFDSQARTIVDSTTGHFIFADDALVYILGNNFRVLLWCFMFSALFGSGALFILAWNASVMSVAIGSAITQSMGTLSGSALEYTGVIFHSLATYLTHGIPEIIGYFVAGLAGGLLYYAVINQVWNPRLAKDITILGGLACVTILAAGLLEVGLSPFFLM